jgi:hypothetical protein
MATASPDGNRVGTIIQSMFARIIILWVRAERESTRRESLAQPHARQHRRQLRRVGADHKRYRSAVRIGPAPDMRRHVPRIAAKPAPDTSGNSQRELHEWQIEDQVLR